MQSLAGVVGGEATGCDEATDTVFLECALFDPVHVALTGRRHMVHSDARQRFERGIDPALLPAAVEAATRMILELCGGEASEVTAAGAEPAWQRNATLRFARLATLGGLAVPAEDAVGSLQRLGFSVVARDAERVTVGGAVLAQRHRRAERARSGAGHRPRGGRRRARRASSRKRISSRKCCACAAWTRCRRCRCRSPAPIPRPTLTPRQARAAFARRVLAARGLLECVTFSFLAREQAALFGADDPALRLSNPIAADLDQLRATPVATLALAAARNAARGWPDLGLFEIGPAFSGAAPDAQPTVAAGLRAGNTPRHWHEPARPVDAMDAKADACAVLAALGVAVDALSATADAPAFYHPGQSGVLRQGPRALATFGVLHPRVLAALDLSAPAVALRNFSRRDRRSRSGGARARPTCRHSCRCGAISPSSWTRR